MDLSTILGTISSTFQTIEFAISTRDQHKIEMAMKQFNTEFIQLQNSCVAINQINFSLQQENFQLARQVGQATQTSEKLKNYRRHVTLRGGIVLINEEAKDSDQKPAYLCINCAEGGKITFLQPEQKSSGLNLFCNEHGAIPSDKPDETMKSWERLNNHMSR